MRKLIMLFFVMLPISCGSDYVKNWNFNWTFLKCTDSSDVHISFQPNAIIESKHFEPYAEHLKFQPNGVLTFSVYIQGSESYVEDFHKDATLHVQLMLNDSIYFDTLFLWDDLKFVNGTDAFGNTNQDVNYKTFYIKWLQ